MKNLIKSSLVLAIAALAFSSCNCFKQMAKNRDDVKVTVVPEVLALNNGTVAADIQVSFPVEYFHKQAIVKVTPVIVFEGGEVAGTPKFYQGTKVDENYTVVDNINGGKFVQHVEFPYDPRMDQCELQLRAEIKCPKGGCKEFTLVNLNNGALPTKEQAEILAGNDEAAKAAVAKEFGVTVAYGLNTLQKDLKYGELMEPMANNYKKVTTVVNKTDLLYAINSSVVTKKNERKANLGEFKADVDEKLNNDRATQNIAVKGYASPDGPEKFNDKLSQARSKTGKAVVAKLLKKTGLDVDAAAYGEDWEGFKELVEKSNIKDKNLILQVLSLYSSSAQRENEIKNMSTVFNELKSDILPELQSCKSQIAVVVLQAMARKFSVDRIDILTHFGGECFAAPGIVFFPADQLGIVVAHETGLSALGVFVEHTSVGCYESFKRCGVGRQAVDIVILLPESCEHVVE